MSYLMKQPPHRHTVLNAAFSVNIFSSLNVTIALIWLSVLVQCALEVK